MCAKGKLLCTSLRQKIIITNFYDYLADMQPVETTFFINLWLRNVLKMC